MNGTHHNNETEANMTAPKCLLQVQGVNAVGARWCQETFETASRDARKRAAQLRKAGFTVHVSPMGDQVTSVGRIKLTMVDIRDFGDRELPPVEVVR